LHQIFSVKVMARITLEYNVRNKTANRMIDIILAMDNVFKVQVQVHTQQNNGNLTAKAIQDAENGNLITCESFDEYLKYVR